MFLRIVTCAVLAAVFSAPQLAAATTVHMVLGDGTVTIGTIDIELYDDQAPKTVANFLRYAGRGDYTTNGFIHRHGTIIPDGVSVIQGGGYAYLTNPLTNQPVFFHIPTDPPVQNEFSPLRSNTRGTIAMAKLSGLQDSATSEWYFNLADNSAALDDTSNSGGFTVFGNVIDTPLDPGMTVVDAIANLPILSVSLPMSNGTTQLFSELPVINYDPTIGLQPWNLVMVTLIPNVTATKTQVGTATKTTSAYAADIDVALSNPNSNKTVDPNTSATWLATFTPPTGKTVQFNDEISRFKMTWTTGPASRVVTLYHGANTSVNGYYAYGPTLDNPTPHWYDFSYDGTTGAEFAGDKILLHFVDGQRGDDDLTADGSITHTGAPVLVTDTATSSTSSSGCSIAAMPSPMRGGGDWIVVSMFLAFVALVRRRTRRDRIGTTQH